MSISTRQFPVAPWAENGRCACLSCMGWQKQIIKSDRAFFRIYLDLSTIATSSLAVWHERASQQPISATNAAKQRCKDEGHHGHQLDGGIDAGASGKLKRRANLVPHSSSVQSSV